MRAVDDLILAGILVCVGLGSCLSCDAKLVEGQDRTARPIDAQLAAGGVGGGALRMPPSEPAFVVLARALVAEADGHHADYAPILAVMQARADRVRSTPARIAVRYSQLYRVSRPTPRQVEILALPTTLPRARVAMWTRAADAAQRWLAGDHAHGCDATPTHFGDRHGDAARAARMRWAVVSCGDTVNGFWRERAR